MFTGIVESMGTVKRLARKVTEKTGSVFSADVSAETMARTNIKLLKSGEKVNLEKSLRMNSFLGGHLVLGHVDGMGKIKEKITKANSIQFGVEIDNDLSRYVVEKGSVAVDGISLTVNSCEKSRFHVNIIPHTARNTTLEFKKVADLVNIETDIIAKYVEKFLNPGKGIDMNFLAKHGFLK
jgi:riboflavin synthase